MYYLEDLRLCWKGEQILDIYKPLGLTPKDVADKVKELLESKKVAFSGRLDPMAHGILRFFLNDACGLAQKANNLNKVYRFLFAFHVSSSSGDLLGYCKIHKPTKSIILAKILSFLKQIQSCYLQQVPVHSSLPVANKHGEKHPLWWWAKKNRLSEVEVPCLLRYLYSFTIHGFHEMSLSDLVEFATERIKKISDKHDFEQEKIISEWIQIGKGYEKKVFPIVTFEMTATVSSGFYIRQLVRDIGEYIDIPTITLDIERLGYT
jgi:tRNA U55 pseudouridine synthase TruB